MCSLTRIGIPIIKMRQSWDHLVYIIEILRLIKGHIYIESALRKQKLVIDLAHTYLILKSVPSFVVESSLFVV